MKIRIIKKNNEAQKPLTLRQERVIHIVGNRREIGSKAGVLREAGYSQSTIDHPDRVFNSQTIKVAIEQVTEKMMGIRNKVLDTLEKKSFEKESPYSLAMISSIMTKNLELLESGRSTAREEYELPEEEKARLCRLLKLNS